MSLSNIYILVDTNKWKLEFLCVFFTLVSLLHKLVVLNWNKGAEENRKHAHNQYGQVWKNTLVGYLFLQMSDMVHF